MSQYDELLEIVNRGDANEIEGARDLIKPEDMDDLIRMYWALETWDQKSCLMQLFSDNIAPQAREAMLDFLKAPDDTDNDEYIYSGKLNALIQLEGSFENAEKYWDDRELGEAEIESYRNGQIPPSPGLQFQVRSEFASPSVRENKKWWEFWK